MIISPSNLYKYWRINPATILHVGAHRGEENYFYQKLGWGRSGVIWVEAQEDLCEDLRTRLDPKLHTVINAVVWGTSNLKMDLNVSNNGESTSLLKFGTHSITYPDVVNVDSRTVLTTRLDEVIHKEFSCEFINIDIQGAELEALKGMGDLLNRARWIYLEVNREDVYVGCPRVKDLDAYLSLRGFKREFTVWQRHAGWGDAIYINEKEKRVRLWSKFLIFMTYRIKPIVSKLFRMVGFK